jgi:hypothetical protein
MGWGGCGKEFSQKNMEMGLDGAAIANEKNKHVGHTHEKNHITSGCLNRKHLCQLGECHGTGLVAP